MSAYKSIISMPYLKRGPVGNMLHGETYSICKR